MAGSGKWDRRSALRAAAVMAGVAAAAPLLGRSATAQPGPGPDADALFKAGRFEQAGRAYEEILKKDPTNVHAASQRGYVALLSNRFAEAEKYLKMALGLAPGDPSANRLMADCYLRQDKLSLSAHHLRVLGDDVDATWFEAVHGEPYQLHGDTARLPWLQMDPTPMIEASVNGGAPKRFMFYTGAPWLGLSMQVAEEAGLTAVAKQKIDYLDGYAWQYFGVLESFKLGDIELRNIPVGWSEAETNAADPGGAHDGLIGSWVFWHLLTTFDYAGRSLILRRPTPEAIGKAPAGAEPLPLWLAGGQEMYSLGSIDGSGPRVTGLSIGGISENVAVMSVETAKQLRIRIDYDRPLETYAHSHPTVVYPCFPDEVRLGDAAARGFYSVASPDSRPPRSGFDVPFTLFHPFYKPYNLTLDFTGMKMYVARGKAG
ncbi:tetratricopeptide repeat protein [Labedaea rhizosphaerae]|uniref:tetratricopeptide repeat protein n=1 Tax=Labedaea rhizosphaerae TaxID=598644 RepID=UPI00105BDB54|nr:tetratricopeptide repeat protein [Labedaea rhizosphaerae]